MSQIITTLKNVIVNESFNVADYPSCKFFLPVTETSGLVLHDLVGDQDLTFSGLIDSVFTFSGGAATVVGSVGISSAGTETLPDLGSTQDFVQLVVADYPTDNRSVRIGSTASESIRAFRKSGTGKSAILDVTPTTTTFAADTSVDGNTQALAIVTDRAAPNETSIIETDGTTVTTGSAITLTATAGINLNSGIFYVDESISLYGSATFLFDSIPADVEAAVSWMNYQWRNGNKVLYPPWRYMT